MEQNLADSERILGPNRPHTPASRNNLACAYQDAGKLEKAIDLFEQTLADFERILGPDHPHTLITRNNLARAYQDIVMNITSWISRVLMTLFTTVYSASLSGWRSSFRRL